MQLERQQTNIDAQHRCSAENAPNIADVYVVIQLQWLRSKKSLVEWTAVYRSINT